MISRNEIALMTGVDPSRTCMYMLIGRVACDPTVNIVVLKFSKDMRNATAAPPIIEGRRYLRVMNQSTWALFAPRLYAASSSERSNFFRRAETTSATIVEMKDDCPSTTSQNPGTSQVA